MAACIFCTAPGKVTFEFRNQSSLNKTGRRKESYTSTKKVDLSLPSIATLEFVIRNLGIDFESVFNLDKESLTICLSFCDGCDRIFEEIAGIHAQLSQVLSTVRKLIVGSNAKLVGVNGKETHFFGGTNKNSDNIRRLRRQVVTSIRNVCFEGEGFNVKQGSMAGTSSSAININIKCPINEDEVDRNCHIPEIVPSGNTTAIAVEALEEQDIMESSTRKVVLESIGCGGPCNFTVPMNRAETTHCPSTTAASIPVITPENLGSINAHPRQSGYIVEDDDVMDIDETSAPVSKSKSSKSLKCSICKKRFKFRQKCKCSL